MTTPPNDADKELREKLIGIVQDCIAFPLNPDEFLLLVKKLDYFITADRQRTRQAVLDEVLGVLPDDDIVMSKYGYNSDEKKYGFRIGITEVKQAITALKVNKTLDK